MPEEKLAVEYYRYQIKGLLLILSDNQGMIARDYVAEKLKMILNEGINFHPSIIEKLEEVKND